MHHVKILLFDKFYLNVLRSNDTVEVIPASIANVQFPQIVIKFYESRIKFKDSPSKK